jgi:hypothetical protein
MPVLLAGSQATVDAVTTYRVQVMLRQPGDLARLQTLGVTVLDRQGDAATVLAGEDQRMMHSSQAVGTGPGGTGDGLWTFTIPAQREVNEGKALKFSLAARDGDDGLNSSANDNGGAYFTVPIAGGLFHIYLPVILRGYE